RLEIFDHPVADCRLHLRQMAFEKVIGVRDDDQLAGLRGQLRDSPHMLRRAKLVARAAHKQFGTSAAFKEAVGINSSFRAYRRSQRNQPGNAFVSAGHAQAGRGTEREPAKDDGPVKLRIQPVERGANVALLALSLVMLALAHSRAAKIEAQNGKAKPAERL